MTDNSHAPDMIDDGASDVMAEDELLLAAGHPDNTVCGPRGKTSERLPCRCRP